MFFLHELVFVIVCIGVKIPFSLKEHKLQVYSLSFTSPKKAV